MHIVDIGIHSRADECTYRRCIVSTIHFGVYHDQILDIGMLRRCALSLGEETATAIIVSIDRQTIDVMVITIETTIEHYRRPVDIAEVKVLVKHEIRGRIG